MAQDITKEEAERRLIEKMRAMLDGAVPAPQHAAMMVGYSDFVEAKDMLAQQPKRWTEAEVRREFERDVRRRFGNVVVVDMRIYNTNGTPLHEHSIGKDVERALRLWYGIDDLAGRDESCMSELQYKQINRPETRNCALGVVGCSVAKPAERDMITGDADGFFAVHGSPKGPHVISVTYDPGTNKMFVNGDLKQATRDCVYVPRAWRLMEELTAAGYMATDIDCNDCKPAVVIIAKHLGEPVPDTRRRVMTLHSRELEPGRWECRIETPEAFDWHTVTGPTREAVEAAAEWLGKRP